MFSVKRHSLLGAIAIVGIVCIIVGCNSQQAFEFDALDMVPPPEELMEFSLGEYRIPIPVAEDRGKNQLTYCHRFQIDFELHALVSPAEQSQVADAWSRHEGKIRDQVIRVCRNASVEELQEPELATLKARLMHALAAPVGQNEVRQLLLTEVVSQEI
jgi:Flagellar basal body-associated protein FliL